MNIRNSMDWLSSTHFSTWLLLSCTLIQGAQAAPATHYNLTQYSADSASRVSLPATWQPNPGTVNYAGSLDVHWLARLNSNNESATISRANAQAKGTPADFSLVTAPDNCWGMDMGYGLVTLAQSANLTITVAADSSSIKPAFGFYRGWDSGSSASRHDTIFFGDNNPLGTQGLTFLGDQLGTVAGGSVSRTFTNLAAGNYELFVTVGNNDSAGGAYKVMLTTTPVGGGITVPGAPTNVTAIAGNSQATVSWTAPANNGGAPITSYTVTSAPGNKQCSSAVTNCTITGLTNGTPYTFSVVATNSAGNGPASAPSNPVTPIPAPINGACGSAHGVPTATKPTANLCSAGTPGSVGGTGPWTWSCAGSNGGSTASCSAPLALIAPGPVTNVSATPGNGQATVAWNVPSSGGTPSQYTVTSSPHAKTCSVAHPAASCTITGLTNGTPYTFSVVATNSAGNGPASAPSNPVTPLPAPINGACGSAHGVPTATKPTANLCSAGTPGSVGGTGPWTWSCAGSNGGSTASCSAPLALTAPGPVTNVSATPGNGQATVAWNVPSSGGTPSQYTVTSSPHAKTCSVAHPAASCTITGLTNGTPYTFSVVATNSAGNGPASVPSNPVTPTPAPINGACGSAHGVPTATKPTANLCSAGTPGSVGGTGPWTWSCAGSNGGSTASCSAPLALTAPGPVTNVSATAGDRQVLVSWSPPVTGSSPLGYSVVSSPEGKSCVSKHPSTSCTVDGLINGNTYTFAVTANNSAGEGPVSTPSNPVTPSAGNTLPSNITYNLNPEGTLPPLWNRPADGYDYKGSLPVYWWVNLLTDSQTTQLDRADAISQGASQSFELKTGPVNDNGTRMNFGLVNLKVRANLSVTVSADATQGSTLTPGFVLYRGWDQGNSANRHGPVNLDADNPLGTQGLIHVDKSLGSVAGGSATHSFEKLEPGEYEIFVTVGNNQSSTGGYVITLTTTPVDSDPQLPINGMCGEITNQFTPAEPAVETLCRAGQASDLTALPKSRYGWLCNGIGTDSTSERCYTLGSDNRLNQEPLYLRPGNASLSPGQKILEFAQGGSGKGGITFKKNKVTPGTMCSLMRGGKKLSIKVRGKPGHCQITAIKAKSRGFNSVESPPITIELVQPTAQ